MPDISGIIFDIDHFAVHDGPGIRTVVYLKGCPLRCAWCHSPESQMFELQTLYIKDMCRGCEVCKGEGCINGARRVCGSHMSVDEVMSEVCQDSVFFETSGGGLTLTGGEVLSQPLFAGALLKAAKDEAIHTVVETSGFGAWGAVEEIARYTDVFYYDIKCVDARRHKEFTGVDNTSIVRNLEKLSKLRKGGGIVLRAPLIPGCTDGEENVAGVYELAERNGISEVHLLPYNQSSAAKYEWVGREYRPGKLERQTADYLLSLKGMAPQALNVEIM